MIIIKECERCAACCTEKTVALSQEDVDRISERSSINFYRVRGTGSKIMNWKDHQERQYCVFLNLNTKRCDIYEDRPKVCKEYLCDKITFNLK